MTLRMQQTLLRRGCERLRLDLALCGDLPAGELLLARLSMQAIAAMANRGPMLALPWTEHPQPDQKMKAAHDDTFES